MKKRLFLKSSLAALIINAAALAEDKTGTTSINSGAIQIFGFQFNTVPEIIFCCFAALFLIGLVFVAFEHFISMDRRQNNLLKANIEKLRNEDFEILASTDLKRLRSSLINKAKARTSQSRIIKARKHEIATGEIDLAMKIKSLMNN